MKHKYLHIDLEKKQYQLDFELVDTPVTELWIERMETALEKYPLDDPQRFYGFNGLERDSEIALRNIQHQIDTINGYKKIIGKKLSRIDDQDTLNYLHNIFEKYHGLLDQQQHEFWNTAPARVKQALSELNIAVHRCESTYRKNSPRFVCTWFGLSKGPLLSQAHMTDHGELGYRWGGVYLNYVEIGKTFEDLEIDQDEYIGADAFKPFQHYSADFCVRFEDTTNMISQQLDRLKNYFDRHRDFFVSRGHGSYQDPLLMPYKYRLAQIIEKKSRTEIISDIAKHQRIERVYFS